MAAGEPARQGGGAVHVKICGITCVEDAELAIAAGASSIGLNFVPGTPRAVDVETARRIVERVAGRALVVAVTADLPLDAIVALRDATGVGCVQLHGDEPPEVVRALLPHAYRALRVGGPADVAAAEAIPGEHLLVDAKVPGQRGGTGARVDWDLVAPLARTRRLTLAGGLNADNVAEAIARVRPYAVDVASGVEREGDPRRKDAAKVEAFCRAVRGAS